MAIGIGSNLPLNSAAMNTLVTQNTQNDDTFKKELELAYSEQDKEKLKSACQDFESIMMNILYKQMKSTIPKSDLVEKSNAQQIFEDMLDEELMTNASRSSNGSGIATMLYSQLSRNIDKIYKNPNL